MKVEPMQPITDIRSTYPIITDLSIDEFVRTGGGGELAYNAFEWRFRTIVFASFDELDGFIGVSPAVSCHVDNLEWQYNNRAKPDASSVVMIQAVQRDLSSLKRIKAAVRYALSPSERERRFLSVLKRTVKTSPIKLADRLMVNESGHFLSFRDNVISVLPK